MERLLVFYCAASLTNATMSGISSGSDDSTLDDKGNIIVGPGVKKRNLVTDQVFQIWYQFFLGALTDKSWPDPQLTLGGAAGGLNLSGLAGVLGSAVGGPAGLAAAAPGIISAIESLIGTAKAPTTTPVAPVANPVGVLTAGS